MTFDLFLEGVRAAAKRSGIYLWELIYSDSESLSLSAFQNSIEAFSSQFDSALSLRVVLDGKEGTASADSLDAIEPEELVQKAREYALYSDSQTEATVFKGSGLYPEKSPSSVKRYTPDEARRLVLDSLSRILSADERISDSTKVYYDYVLKNRRLANNKGLKLENRAEGNALSFSIKARRDDDVVTYFKSFDSSLNSIDYSALASLATSQLGALKLSSGDYLTVLSPRVMSSLLAAFRGIFSARANYLGLARLGNMEGEVIAAPCLTLVDDPLYPGYSFQMCWDSDGVATQTKRIIERGRLNTLLYNNEWAAKCGKKSTGNSQRGLGRSQISSFSLYIENGDLTLEKVQEQCFDGILVDSVKGLHAGANSVSGDFSLEASGFRIERGKVTYPVKSFTIAGNFYDLLKNVVAIGDDLSFDVTLASSRTGSPSILVKGIKIGGK